MTDRAKHYLERANKVLEKIPDEGNVADKYSLYFGDIITIKAAISVFMQEVKDEKMGYSERVYTARELEETVSNALGAQREQYKETIEGVANSIKGYLAKEYLSAETYFALEAIMARLCK